MLPLLLPGTSRMLLSMLGNDGWQIIITLVRRMGAVRDIVVITRHVVVATIIIHAMK
jgi:hypothetical protein